jgi:hypothetical protein
MYIIHMVSSHSWQCKADVKFQCDFVQPVQVLTPNSNSQRHKLFVSVVSLTRKTLCDLLYVIRLIREDRVELGYNVMKGPNILCRYNGGV